MAEGYGLGFDDMVVAAVNFDPAYVEISFIEADSTDALVQEIRTLRIQRVVFENSGEIADVQETLADMVNRALIFKRNPPNTFTAPR